MIVGPKTVYDSSYIYSRQFERSLATYGVFLLSET